MSNLTEKPLAIVAVCTIGLINAIQMLQLVFSPIAKQLHGMYSAYFMAAIIASLTCLAGLWFMRRWAAISYALILGINQLVLANMKLWEVSAMMMPLIIVVLLAKYYSEMN